ncbi:cysteine hydrolase family protein [Agarivorans sp.]|uniref:cysteine hydrolase family protein n=1 Tax=Agarivorans sp. TaxID=1872412 RepID=UPI003D066792
MSQRALLLIDFQQEYLSAGKLPLQQINQAVAKAIQLLEYHRQLGDNIIHVHHVNSQPEAAIFIADTPAIQPIDGLQASDNELVLIKHRPNAFVQTSLEQLLKEANINELIIAGAMSHMCIEASTRAAVDLGFKCTVIENACATRELEFNGVTVPAKQVHAASMAALAFAYAEVVSYEQFIGAVD